MKVNTNQREIIRPKDLQNYTGLSRTTIWRLEKENKFVPKIQLTEFSIGYKRADIDRWIDERAQSNANNLNNIN